MRGEGRKGELGPEPTEPRGGGAERGGKVEKERADQGRVRTKTWEDVVKVLKEGESETTDLDKSWNESETTDSIEESDLDKPNRTMAKWTKG